MGAFFKIIFSLLLTVSLPASVLAENWIEFHQVKWSQRSEKLKRKLNYSTRYFYDADSLNSNAAGIATLWVKEISENDRYYVKRGNPESETLFKKIHFWCALKKYEIVSAGDEDAEANELLSENIQSGSYYEKLFLIACKNR